MVSLINCRQGGDNDYKGMSTDDKPTEGVLAGSMFLELDTIDLYYYDGEEWLKVGTSPD